MNGTTLIVVVVVVVVVVVIRCLETFIKINSLQHLEISK